MSRSMRAIGTLLLATVLHLGCGVTVPPATGPVGVRTITIEPIDNRTGDALVIDDPGLLGRTLDGLVGDWQAHD